MEQLFFFDGEDEYNTDTRHDEHEQRAAADYVHVRTDRVGEDVRVGSTRTQAEEFLTTTQRRAKSLFIYHVSMPFVLLDPVIDTDRRSGSSRADHMHTHARARHCWTGEE